MATAGGRGLRDTVIEPPRMREAAMNPRMRETVIEPARMRETGSASTLPPPDLGGPSPRAAPKPRRSAPVAAAPDQGRELAVRPA